MSEITPLVSVIMPVYCGEKFIEEAIRSVLNQTYTHWELIVINDGSTDNTEAVVFQFQDSRIHYFLQENKGVSAARNVGLSEMNGDFFCFLDADDVMPTDSLEWRIKKFGSDSSIVFVDGIVSYRDHFLKTETARFVPKVSGVVFSNLVRLDMAAFAGNTWMIKRNRDKEYQLITGLSHAEDLCFYLSLAKQGSYDFVEEEVLWYRKGHTSAMSNVKGLEKGYHFYYNYAKSLGAEKKDLTYLKWRLRRIIFLSYLFDNKAPWAALRSLFHNYK